MRDQFPTLPSTIAAALRKSAQRFVQFDSEGCSTVASYNVHKCVGTDGRFDPRRILAVVAELDADLVALQEADERMGSRRGLLDLDLLKRETGLVPLYRPDNELSHGWHGNVLLARKSVVHHVKQVKLPGLEPRGAVIVDLDVKGTAIRVVAAHFGLLRRSRAQQAAAIVEATRPIVRPTILMGDLNEWRVRNRSSLMELLPHFGPLHAVLPSFPSRFPLLALDRILARPANLISSIEVHQTPLSRLASDHLPIKARVNLAALTAQAQPDAA